MPARYRRKRRLEEDLVRDATVVAFDPGGTTGWSVMAVHPEALTDPDISILDNMHHWTHGELNSQLNGRYDPEMEMRCVDEMISIAEAWPGAAVVIEDFILNNMRKDRETLSPVRIMSMFEWAMRPTAVFRQMPSEKSGATDERLKAWNLYEREGGAGHARDGDRHAIVLLRKAKAQRARRYLYWPHLYDKNGILIG